MNRAARIIATMAMAFLLAPTLFADDTTKPKAKAKDEAAASSAVPSTAEASSSPSSASSVAADTQPQPDAAGALAVRSAITLAPPEANADSMGAMHRWDDREGYTPKVEWFLGYSFWRATPTSNGNRMGYLHGGSTSVAYNFNRYVGFVADFAGFDDNRVTLFGPAGSETFNSGGSAYTFMVGPRLSYRKYAKFTPYAQVLAGVVHASPVTISGCAGDPELHADRL